MHGDDSIEAIILMVAGTFVFVGVIIWSVVMERAEEKDKRDRRK